ncbi:MAG: hypothetical protein JO133_10115 [Burkholderiaceae bacterium]|nr:hypothetical protein [Burkholderiaceae bacterium]
MLWIGSLVCNQILTNAAFAITPISSAAQLPLPPLDRFGHPLNPVPGSEFGIYPNSGNDLAQKLNSALASLSVGQMLVLSPGKYSVGSQLELHSGTGLYGSSDSAYQQGAVITSTGAVLKSFLVNANHDSNSLFDSGLAVVGMSFDYGNLNDASVHAVEFRNASHILVLNSRFNGGGDGTAFIGCIYTKVSASLATNTLNAGFDHWDGTSWAVVENSAVVASCRYGILFNAMDTDGAGRHTENVSATGNSISGITSEAGVYVAPLSADSSINGVTLTNNSIAVPRVEQVQESSLCSSNYQQVSPTLGGIVVKGSQNVVVSGHAISNTAPDRSLLVINDAWHQIANVSEVYNLAQIYRYDCPFGHRLGSLLDPPLGCRFDANAFRVLAGSNNSDAIELYNCTKPSGHVFTSVDSGCEGAAVSSQSLGYIGVKQAGPLQSELFRCNSPRGYLTTVYPQLECTPQTGFTVEVSLGWVALGRGGDLQRDDRK